MSSATSPALPAFSYAQAAKGRAQPNTIPQTTINASSTPSQSSSRERKSSSGEPAKLELTAKSVNGKSEYSNTTTASHSIQDEQKELLVTNGNISKENVGPAKRSVSSSEDNKATVSEASSPSLGATSTSTLPKEEDMSFAPNDTTDSWEKQSRVSNPVEKSTQTAEGNKANSLQEDWEREPASNSPAEKELKAAPLPIVNFWQARKEAQDAKAKAVAAQRPAAAVTKVKTQPATAPENQKGPDEDSRRKQTNRPPTKVEKDENIGRKRQTESAKGREDGRRQQPRQPRSPGQELTTPEHSALPPVADANSWPTPETAISDERKKSTSQDRPEKPESKNGGAKSHSKQWVPIPYVPSAKFITTLPLAATRRGGRPAIRGGPEEAGRIGPTTQVNPVSSKNDGPVSMGPPPLPKQNGEQERGRNQSTPSASRANSVPTQATRATSTSAGPPGQRAFSGTANKDRAEANNKKQASPEERASTELSPKNEPESTARLGGDSSFNPKSAHPTNSAFRRGSLEASRQSGPAGDSHSHSHPRADPTNRRSMPAELYTNADVFGTHEHSGSGRNKDFSKSRDYSKDKVESSRDKVSSWRDREVTYDKEGREQRPERSRGGYRGRGTHTTYGMHPASAHAFTAPVPQQPFTSAKSNTYSSGHRQSSQPYPALSSQSGQRGNIRSQSIPTNGMYNSVTNTMPAMQQPLSPLQTDMSMYGYQQPMYPGYMSALPHNTALDSYALLAMVHSQLEYYFSIDNLCKDMFLRKHMDSQGYVLLSVIADFKRIKALTEDMDMLRHVCGQLKTIEFRPGEDGVDRLRRKEGWEPWIRPMSERDPSARNDGPPAGSRPPYRKHGSSERSQFGGLAFSGPNFRNGPVWNNEGYREASSVAHGSTMHANAPTFDSHMSETPVATTLPEIDSQNRVPSSNEDTNPLTDKQSNESTDKAVAEDTNGPVTNGHSAPTHIQHEEDVFPDEKIAELKVVVRNSDAHSPSLQPTFLANASRTFSHGSIDGHSFSSDAQLNGSGNSVVPNLRGGSGSSEQLDRGRAQAQPSSGQIEHLNYQSGSLPVFWVKDGAPLVGLHQEGLAHEPYESLYNRALEQRLYGNLVADMEVLYQFWSHFLIRNFNVRMYDEFHARALEDFGHGADSGLQHLVRYYEALLSGQTPLTERIANDLVRLVQGEPNDSPRPAFHILRAAWRNGAFNLKSRKRVDTLLTPAMRAELEK